MTNPICLENTNTINTISLPLILAGPIVRRAESKSIYVWVCTSKKLMLGIRFYKGRAETNEKEVVKGKIIGEGFGETVQVGKNLYVTLLTALPKIEIVQFPQGEEISYEIFILASEKSFNSTILLLDKKERSLITIDSADNLSPSFCLQKDNYDDLRVAFGSCRKFHGEAEDMTSALFEQAYEAKKDALLRPNGLFLLGDQIYADDVSDITLRHIKSINFILFDYSEIMSNPTDESKPIKPHTIKLGGRQQIICDAADFSSTDGANHLAALSEFCVMYLLAFNDKIWSFAKKTNTGLNGSSDEDIDKAISGSGAMRRILANTPSYMMCDDHEITDDWNITNEWRKRVSDNPLGRRIVTNGLCAFWFFQGWGNDPIKSGARHISLKTHAEKLLSDPKDVSTNKATLDNFHNDLDWTFLAPTTPPTLFLDTRFGRKNSPMDSLIFDAEKCFIPFYVPKKTDIYSNWEKGDTTAPVLISRKKIDYIKNLLEKYKTLKGLIIATPTPVFGLQPIENILKDKYREKPGNYGEFMRIEREFWSCNPYGVDNFINLIDELNTKDIFNNGNPEEVHIKILAGDVHYSFYMCIKLQMKLKTGTNIEMLTSSAIKNPPEYKNIAHLLVVKDSIKNKFSWERRKSSSNQVSFLIHSLASQNWDYKYNTELKEMPVYPQGQPGNFMGRSGSFGYLKGKKVYFIYKPGLLYQLNYLKH